MYLQRSSTCYILHKLIEIVRCADTIGSFLRGPASIESPHGFPHYGISLFSMSFLTVQCTQMKLICKEAMIHSISSIVRIKNSLPYWFVLQKPAAAIPRKMVGEYQQKKRMCYLFWVPRLCGVDEDLQKHIYKYATHVTHPYCLH